MSLYDQEETHDTAHHVKLGKRGKPWARLLPCKGLRYPKRMRNRLFRRLRKSSVA